MIKKRTSKIDLGSSKDKFGLFVSIITRIGNYSDKSKAIVSSLEDLSKFSGCEHSFIFMFDEKKQDFSDMYHYSSKPLKSAVLLNDVVKGFAWGREKIKRGEIAYIGRDESLKGNEKAIEELAVHGIKSVIQVPIKSGEDIYGFIGLFLENRNGVGAEVLNVIIAFSKVMQNIMEMKMVEDALRKSGRELSFRNQVAEAFITENDENVLKKVLNIFLSSMSSRRGAIGYVDPSYDIVFYRLLRNQQDGEKLVLNINELPENIKSLFLNSRISVFNEPVNVSVLGLNAERMLLVPVMHGIRTIGCLLLCDKSTDYNDQDVKQAEVNCEILYNMLDSWLRKKTYENETKSFETQLFKSQKMESIGRLAGGIAHDFNNLICGILGHASLIKQEVDNKHPFYESLEIIETSSRRAAELTANLLSFAKGGKYNVEAIDLNEVLKETLKLISATFDKAIEVVFELDENLPLVDADHTHIQQIFMNLCVNARDAMPEGGRITITTHYYEQEKEYDPKLPEVRKGKYSVISVKDTGVGMDKETLSKIFEPFFTTKEKGKGTGLGLATVYGIVKKHNGYIDVRSEINKGSSFSVYFPISEKQNKVVKENIETSSISGRNELVLLIDDEQSLLNLEKRILVSHNYRVLEANSGQEALKLLRDNAGQVSLVVLDLVMPGINGYDLFKQIKELSPGSKVLLSSGNPEDGKAQKILESGANGLIQKPFEIDGLLLNIRKMLESE